jgi:hypothetical protein
LDAVATSAGVSPPIAFGMLSRLRPPAPAPPAAAVDHTRAPVAASGGDDGDDDDKEVEWVYSDVHGHRIAVRRGAVLGFNDRGQLELIDLGQHDSATYAARLAALRRGGDAGGAESAGVKALIAARVLAVPRQELLDDAGHPFNVAAAAAGAVQHALRYPSLWCRGAAVTPSPWEARLDDAMEAAAGGGGWLDVSVRDAHRPAVVAIQRAAAWLDACRQAACDERGVGVTPTAAAGAVRVLPLLDELAPAAHLPLVCHMLALLGFRVDAGRLTGQPFADGSPSSWSAAFWPPPHACTLAGSHQVRSGAFVTWVGGPLRAAQGTAVVDWGEWVGWGRVWWGGGGCLASHQAISLRPQPLPCHRRWPCS